MEKEINLLPELIQRRRTRRLYLSRFGRFLNRIYLLLLVLIVVLVAILTVVESIKKSVVSGGVRLTSFHSDVADEVRYVNQVLWQFEERRAGYMTWSSQVMDVLIVAPEAVRLTGLEVSETKPMVLSISGVASSRSAMVAYQRKLEGLDWVEQVEAPLQNFALEPESDFSFSLRRR